MNKINIYLFYQANKYIAINFLIISIFILFINFIELSRILQNSEKSLINYLYLTALKYPSILNQIIPFVIILSVAFLIRNLLNNNELISMRNLGFSIIDIFTPIALSIFIVGIIFLAIINPLSVTLENKHDKFLNQNEAGLYSIKIIENQMWIKNKIDENNYSFINIKNIDLKNMEANDIKILLINNITKKLILAKSGTIKENLFILNDVIYYNFTDEKIDRLKEFNLIINFNKENILNSINKYKLIPFYKYLEHSKALAKFNLYSPEIGLFYLSEIFKPIFLVMLSFVVLGFAGKFKRNENFFKVLFITISIGFIVYLYTEIINKLTIIYSINFYLSYTLIFFIPFLIGLYQVIRIEND